MDPLVAAPTRSGLGVQEVQSVSEQLPLNSRSRDGAGAQDIDRCTPVVVDRQLGAGGEIALRRVGDEFEIIYNGVFLMDTRDGSSERLLARAALDAHRAPRRVLVAGLGAGFTLNAVLEDRRVQTVTVVELEPAVVGWHRTVLAGRSGPALDDPRVEMVVADAVELLCAPDPAPPSWDVICIDIDNGPDWTVTGSNDRLYSAEGTNRVRDRLRPAGVLSVWSAHRVPAYRATLNSIFAHTAEHHVPTRHGAPDVVYLAVR